MDNNVERWDGLRLWVYRTRHHHMPCAVIMRSSRGGQQHDTLLGRHEIPPHLVDVSERDPYVALLAALTCLRGAVFVENEFQRILRARAAASPVGDHGGTEPLDIHG